MDSKTRNFLFKLNQQAAKMFKTKTIKDDAGRELKEKAEWAYQKTGDERIKKQLDAGVFEPRDKRVVDDKSTNEIDKFFDYKINQAIRSGEIKKAPKDEFISKIQKKLQ